MKQLKRQLHYLMAALVLCLAVNGANAQGPVLPSNTDNHWFYSYSNSNPIQGLNTATIAYGTAPGQGVVVGAYYDGSGHERIEAFDNSIGQSYSLPSNGTIASTPDVIIGNWDGVAANCGTCISTATDYIAAVAYVNSSGNIAIDYYDVYDDRTGIVTINATPVHTAVSVTGYVPHTVHLDIIAEYNNVVGGFPFCDNFVITWDDFTTAASPNVYAQDGHINVGVLSGTVHQINPTGGGGNYGYAPDVAAVQQLSGSRVDEVGWITYVDGGGNTLYFGGYDFSAASALTPITLDNGSTSGSISSPRIDAYDDYFSNSTSEPYSVYKVVAQVDSTAIGKTVVRSYDNVMNAASMEYTCSDNVDISAVPGYSIAPTYNCFAPTVALGSPLDYKIQHFMNYGGSGDDILFVEPVNMADPYALASGDYYWVNSTTTTTTGTNINAAVCNYANAVSAYENYPSAGYAAYAWAFQDPSTNKYTVHYKYPTSSTYAFRQGTTAVTTGNTGGGKWQVYPNPATNELAVSNAAGSRAATGYLIVDMAGRTALQGSLHGGQNPIDVSGLVPGTYVLKVSEQGNDDGQAIFVKE